MKDILITLSADHTYLVYAFTIIFGCVEGPILSLVFGVLIKLGYFSIAPIYVCLMLGDLIGDTFWYFIGKHFGLRFVKRFGKYFSITEHNVDKISDLFHKYKHRILFISKISNGFGFSLVTLMTAGIVRIPFWKYLSVNLLGQFVWTGLLLIVGFFFSNLYLEVNTWIGRMSVIALFVMLFFAFIGYKNYIKKKAESLTLKI